MGAATGSLPSIADLAWANLQGEIDARSRDYYCAELETGRAAGLPCSARATNWIRRLHEFELFWVSTRRHPRENTRERSVIPASERRMGEWARYQRRFELDLCAYQRARLDLSPAFEWDPLDAAWEGNLRACGAFVTSLGRLPILTSADREEFRAARWLGRQLDARRAGRLAQERAESIDQVLQLAAASIRQRGTGTFRSH